MDLTDAQLFKGLTERGLKLPPQPRVVEDLQKCRLRKEKDLRVVARVISQDAGIVALLFRAVQSSAYHEYPPFRSIEDIIHAIGIDRVFNLVQAIALATGTMSRAQRKTYEHFWANSTAVAQLAMLVAKDRVTVCNVFPDEAYLAGIFHDCGIPLLMERFPAYCRKLDLDRQELWFSISEEDQCYQTDHSVVGYFVAKHWKLPTFICNAIRFHHDLERVSEHNERSLVAILQMAIKLHCLSLHVVHQEWPDTRKLVLDELGLSEASFPEFSDEILERYNALTAA
ncbi:MAG: HDOD domain-containing protein [Betaproteobacteria bacterium]|nr:HDOD domain-containing protein [Betaproteobacteria bacterium]